MQARFLLDTDTCVYLRKRRPPSVECRFQELQWGEVVMSVITYGELYNGALKSRESEAALMNIQRLSERLPVQLLSVEVGERYGAIRSTLEKEGSIIGGNDLWIAAHCLTLDLILVTNNTQAFSRVHDLRLENWLEE